MNTMTLGPKTARLTSIGGKAARKSTGSRRYSRLVGHLKIILPLSAGILAVAVLVWPQVSGGLRNMISIQSLVSGVDRLTMAKPRYFGVDKDNQSFVITADEAIQRGLSNERIDFVNPKSSLALENGSRLTVDALKGSYWQDGASLLLSGDVRLQHDEGYEVHTQSASVDLDAGSAVGKQPVQGSGPFGEIESEGFQLTDHGKNIVFTGKSKLTLRNTATFNKK